MATKINVVFILQNIVIAVNYYLGGIVATFKASMHTFGPIVSHLHR